jgi:hypothetical protein
MDGAFPGFFQMLKSSWAQYKSNWMYLTKVFVLGYAYTILAILGAIVLILVATVFGGEARAPLIIVSLVLAILAGAYTGAWMQLSMGLSVAKLKENSTDKGVRDIYKRTRPLVFAYLLVMIMQLLIVLVGYIALIIPGIIFSLWFTFTIFTFLVDGKRGVEALILSREYTRGKLGIVFIFFLGFGILSSIVGTVPSYLFERLDIQWLLIFVNIAIALVFTPLGTIFSFNLYSALKGTKGEMSVDYSAARKRKYYLAVIIPLIITIFVAIALVYVTASYIGSAESGIFIGGFQ